MISNAKSQAAAKRQTESSLGRLPINCKDFFLLWSCLPSTNSLLGNYDNLLNVGKD